MNVHKGQIARTRSGKNGEAFLEVKSSDDGIVVHPKGNWVISDIVRPDSEITAIEKTASTAQKLEINLSGISSLDTSGAWLISRLYRNWQDAGGQVSITHPSDYARQLLQAVSVPREHLASPKVLGNPLVRMAENLGKLVSNVKIDTVMSMNIIGSAIRGPQMKSGRHGGVRPISIIHHIDRMGIRAVPIIMLMSFLIGAIIAQQSAFQLRFFGLEVWSVDLVGVLLLREVGVLLTAIMIAGRSGSAMTAEIGSMKMREEVDALTVIGLNPIGVLIFPRLVALTISLPLLTFLANIAALAGAALVLRFYSDVSLSDFILRLRSAIDLSTVFSGMIKAPFMAMIIGVMAAVEGMKVEGSAESLGRRTTAAVVKAIFFVIVVDGLFAIFYAAIDY